MLKSDIHSQCPIHYQRLSERDSCVRVWGQRVKMLAQLGAGNNLEWSVVTDTTVWRSSVMGFPGHFMLPATTPSDPSLQPYWTLSLSLFFSPTPESPDHIKHGSQLNCQPLSEPGPALPVEHHCCLSRERVIMWPSLHLAGVLKFIFLVLLQDRFLRQGLLHPILYRLGWDRVEWFLLQMEKNEMIYLRKKKAKEQFNSLQIKILLASWEMRVVTPIIPNLGTTLKCICLYMFLLIF